MARCVLFFKSKRYDYDFEYPSDPTIENMAVAISAAMVKKDMKSRPGRKHFNLERYKNLITHKLKEAGNIHYPDSVKSDPITNALHHAGELQKNANPIITGEESYTVHIKKYRVGITSYSRLVIEIDSHDEYNLKIVKYLYEAIFNFKFSIIKTLHGYWLISEKKYQFIDDWLYDNCRLLEPRLIYANYKDYQDQLLKLDNPDKSISLTDTIKKSSLYNGFGEFDVIFTFINIKRKIMTLRISKKEPGDRIELIS